MNYTRNAVYTYVSDAIKAQYSNAYCTSRYVAKPAKFPSCYIREIDRNRPIQFTQLDFQDNQWESAFEIQVVSNKANTAASEAYSIMNVAREAFSNLYYREFQESTIDGGDLFTVIARFRRVIGGADEMPITSF